MGVGLKEIVLSAMMFNSPSLQPVSECLQIDVGYIPRIEAGGLMKDVGIRLTRATCILLVSCWLVALHIGFSLCDDHCSLSPCSCDTTITHDSIQFICVIWLSKHQKHILLCLQNVHVVVDDLSCYLESHTT